MRRGQRDETNHSSMPALRHCAVCYARPAIFRWQLDQDHSGVRFSLWLARLCAFADGLNEAQLLAVQLDGGQPAGVVRSCVYVNSIG